MCFSAEASFATSGVLIPLGVYCIKEATQSNRAFIPIAGWSLLFGIQQAFEGFLWLGIGDLDAGLMRSAALGFLFFSHFIWLFWTPFSVFALETRERLRSIFLVLTVAGFLYGGLLYVPLLFDPGLLTIEVINSSIHYTTDYIFNSYVPPYTSFWVYAAIILTPLLLASHQKINWLGGLIFGSALVTYLMYSYAFISVWCFFAAIVSIYLLFAIRLGLDLSSYESEST
jgi:hypothetical protein